MSQKIQFKRGVNSERSTLVFDQGEPVYTVDTRELFVGDGLTTGGILIGPEITTYNESYIAISPLSGSTAVQNGNTLKNVTALAHLKTPYGHPLSEENRYSILLFPGNYDLGTEIYGVNDYMSRRNGFVDFVGIGNKKDIKIITTGVGLSTFTIRSGNCRIENLTILSNAYAIYTNADICSNVEIKNCFISGGMSSYVSESDVQIQSGIKIEDSILVGNFMGTDAFAISPTHSQIINSKIDAYNGELFNGPPGQVFSQISTLNPKNNLISSCHIRANSIFSDYLGGGYGWDESNVVENTRIEVFSDAFYTDDSDFHSKLKMRNCVLEKAGPIYDFKGTMDNCVIDKTLSPGFTMYLSSDSNNNFPTFKNCTFISSPNSYAPAFSRITGFTGGSFINGISGRSTTLGLSFSGRNVPFSGVGNFVPTSYNITSTTNSLDFSNKVINYTGLTYFTGSATLFWTGTTAFQISVVTGYSQISGHFFYSVGTISEEGGLNSTSGLFINCCFNRDMATGITGGFGNRFNTVDERLNRAF